LVFPIVGNKTEPACSACLSAKSKQLPFYSSQSQIKAPLELIFSDLWGPSPVCSRTGNKYYISFLDAYSRYTWLFPISHKNDASPFSFNFKNMLNDTSISKSKLFNLIGEVNFALYPNFLKNVALVIESFCALTLTNKMVQLSANTVI
jgi:hypothetical protein